MKRIFLASALFATLGLALTGCLKDKAFDNHEYGINDPDTQPPGVGFSLGTKTNSYGLDAVSTPQVIDDMVYVALFTGERPQSDVQVTLTDNSTALINAYNTANGTAVQKLPSNLYSLPTTTLNIPSGSYNTQVPLTISNTMTLDPTVSYAVGYTVSSVSGNYKIADNFKNLLIIFTIKNKYDGVYRLQGYHNRTPYTFPYDVEIHMVTVGPSSVAFYWPEAGSVGHPIGVAPGETNWYGPTVAPVVVFDPTTNLVTNVYNSDPAGPPITMFLGAGSRLSKWDPVTKAMTVDWNYNGNPLRAFFDDLTYIGPR